MKKMKRRNYTKGYYTVCFIGNYCPKMAYPWVVKAECFNRYEDFECSFSKRFIHDWQAEEAYNWIQERLEIFEETSMPFSELISDIAEIMGVKI